MGVVLDRVLERLPSRKRVGDQWQAQCPAHEDRSPSLSIGEGSGKVLVHCQAGCDFRSVLAKLGLVESDLFEQDEPGKPRIEAVYQYRDEAGVLLYEVCRFNPKGFRHRRPDGHGGYQWSLNGTRRVPYHLPELLASDPSKPVLIVEGEKDVHTAEAKGFVATTNAGGAGKWRSEYLEALRGRRVVVIPDNDDPGRQHARQVAAAVRSVAESVRVVNLPSVPIKGDLTDFFRLAGLPEQLVEPAIERG